MAMEASGVYTDPVYYALREEDFTEVAVVNPAHVKALKGHKTDAKDCARVTYIKPMLVQAAWAAIRTRGRLQARYNRLVRRMGGPKNPAAKKKAIVAIAHTLLKIACTVLKTGIPYQDPGEDFCTRRETPGRRQAWLESQIQKLHPGCTVTITISPPPDPVPETALTPGA